MCGSPPPLAPPISTLTSLFFQVGLLRFRTGCHGGAVRLPRVDGEARGRLREYGEPDDDTRGVRSRCRTGAGMLDVVPDRGGRGRRRGVGTRRAKCAARDRGGRGRRRGAGTRPATCADAARDREGELRECAGAAQRRPAATILWRQQPGSSRAHPAPQAAGVLPVTCLQAPSHATVARPAWFRRPQSS